MMEKAFTISPARLDALMNDWNKSCRVFVPEAGKKQNADGSAPGWRRLAIGDTGFVLPAGPTAASIKSFYFPQPEPLMSYTLENNHPEKGLMREAARSTATQVVIGVRPCDARSVLLNNLPFADDPLYQANRERTVLVGFSCEQELPTCFCTRMGGSPLGTEGLDLILTRTGADYFLEIVSDKGADLLAGQEDLPLAADADCAELQRRRSEQGKGDDHELAALKTKALTGLYEAPLWQPLGESCINCGACTFLCPTCYCFDIQDEVVRGQGRRIRFWDSCMFPLYSLHTTGHNPRGKKVQRTRNRFLHKLKYFPDRFGPFSCVGCGRCVQDCPVNIDIREVMSDLVDLTAVE
jgi:ferredoxin